MLSQQQLTLLAGSALTTASGTADTCATATGAAAATAAATAATATAATGSWRCCGWSACCACCACWAWTASDSWRGSPAVVSTECGSSVDMAVASSALGKGAGSSGAAHSVGLSREAGQGARQVPVQLRRKGCCSQVRWSAATLLNRSCIPCRPPSSPAVVGPACSSPLSSAVRLRPPASACKHREGKRSAAGKCCRAASIRRQAAVAPAPYTLLWPSTTSQQAQQAQHAQQAQRWVNRPPAAAMAAPGATLLRAACWSRHWAAAAEATAGMAVARAPKPTQPG